MLQQTHKICGRTCAEPVVLDTLMLKSVQQTERIEYSSHLVREMIAVILFFQLSHHLVISAMVVRCHLTNRFIEILGHLISGDSTQGSILVAHTYIVRLVEPTEHTYLRELGNTSKQYKLQMLVSCLEDRIKPTQRLTVITFERHRHAEVLNLITTVHHIKNRLVVFVNEHHAT